MNDIRNAHRRARSGCEAAAAMVVRAASRIGGWRLIEAMGALLQSSDADVYFRNQCVELPEDWGRVGTLNIEKERVRRLSDGSCLREVFAAESDLYEIGEGVSIAGRAVFDHTRLSRIGEDFFVGGDLSVRCVNFLRIPGTARVEGDLHAGMSRSLFLARGFRLGGDLILSQATHPRLPAGFEIGGSLILGGDNRIHLPAGLHVRGNADLCTRSCLDIPEDLRVDGVLAVRKDQEVPDEVAAHCSEVIRE